MSYLKNFGTGWAFLSGNDVITFVDNHDNQRGHGGGGAILNFFDSRKYTIANAFMLAWPYAIVQVMSSYNFDPSKDWEGPPSDAYGNTKDVVINS
jgi:alpha-amylase